MSPSTLYNEFKKRVDELGASILPSIKIDLAYTPEEYDRVRAYVLLVHAEIEAFIEQRIREEVQRRVNEWETSRRPSVILMGLLAFHEGTWTGSIDSLNPHPQGDKNPTWRERDLDTRLKKCQNQMFKAIKANNGVKASDLLYMLLRLGFIMDAIDRELIMDLDSLGSQRGSIAHNSVRVVTSQPDPSSTKSIITGIMTKLQDLDASIAALV